MSGYWCHRHKGHDAACHGCLKEANEERDQLQAQLDASQAQSAKHKAQSETLRFALCALRSALAQERQGAIAREQAVEEARELAREAHLILGGALFPMPPGLVEAHRRRVRRLMAEMERHAWIYERSKEPAERDCPRCRGCGQIANTEQQEPWSYWEQLPEASKVAIRLGIVAPIPCPDCRGQEAPAEEDESG
jgi:hypothetical protein